jgi:hypothetical protein
LLRIFRRHGVGAGRRGNRLGVRVWIGQGIWPGVGGAEYGAGRFADRLFESDLAFAAIAAPETFLAKMVAAGILGAAHADASRFLFANAAVERHGAPYFFLSEEDLGGG